MIALSSGVALLFKIAPDLLVAPLLMVAPILMFWSILQRCDEGSVPCGRSGRSGGSVAGDAAPGGLP